MELIGQGLLAALALIARGDAELLRVVGLSLAVSLTATLLAAVVGVPLGVALATERFPGHGAVRLLAATGMGLPPVVVGLFIMLFLWRSGPLGFLQLLYTPQAMVLAQFIVAVPLAVTLTRAALESLDTGMHEALRVDGAGRLLAARELLHAALPGVLVAVAAAFGRAVAEVGASLMVGGNILGQTRILTTAISLETSRGEFALAIALGMVLLALALLVNVALAWQHGE